MTSSRSITSRSSAWFVVVALVLLTGVASAGRKRVVVLDFDGDKAEKFQADVVKLIKKSHTVVSLEKWNEAAGDAAPSEKVVKKAAKKLKVDGVISGTVEKRRDEYILRMKLRSGVSGAVVGGQVSVKAEGARLDESAANDLKDELIEKIAGLESNRDGGGGEDDDKPKKAAKKADPVEDENPLPKKAAKKSDPEPTEEDKPKKSNFGKKKNGDKSGDAVEDENPLPKKAAKKSDPEPSEDDRPKKSAKKSDPEPSEDDRPKKSAKKSDPDPSDEPGDDDKPKKSKKSKKVAAADPEGGSVEGGAEVGGAVAGETIFSPAERAVEINAGLSFTMRRMSFSYNPALGDMRPSGYKQSLPVPGMYIDATVYPLAIGHKRQGILTGLGLTVLFDRVLSLKSENPAGGNKLSSTEQRYAIGAVFRYPIGDAAKKMVLGASFRYGKRSFTIDGMSALPNVDYSMIIPAAFFEYPITRKFTAAADAGLLVVSDAGDIVSDTQYGEASILGFELNAGIELMVKKNIYARAMFHWETINYTFRGNGDRSDGVGEAKDVYSGAMAMAGYLF